MWSVLWMTVLCICVGAEDRLDLQYLKERILTDIIDSVHPDTYHWVPEVPSEDVAESPSPSPHDEDPTTESSKYSMTYKKDLPRAADGWSRYAYRPEPDFIRGVPGVDYPNYTDIPQTSFTCSEKPYLPGMYADMDTGCQVFHICWPDRRESFLCPVGTTFSQPLHACDYWYKSDCSLAPNYYDSNAESRLNDHDAESNIAAIVDFILGKGQLDPLDITDTKEDDLKVHEDMSYMLKFLPVKAKVVAYPEDSESRPKIVARIGKNIMGSKSREQQKMKSSFIPTHTMHSQAPVETQTSGSRVKRSLKGAYINRSIGLAVNIFNEMLDMIRVILRDFEKLRTVKGNMVQKSMNKPELLAQLKQSFMNKPAGKPKYTKEKFVLPTKAKLTKRVDEPTSEVKPDGTDFSKFSKRQFVLFPSQPMREAPGVSTSRRERVIEKTLNVSASTKERLIENYIRLYRMKKA